MAAWTASSSFKFSSVCLLYVLLPVCWPLGRPDTIGCSHWPLLALAPRSSAAFLQQHRLGWDKYEQRNHVRLKATYASMFCVIAAILISGQSFASNDYGRGHQSFCCHEMTHSWFPPQSWVVILVECPRIIQFRVGGSNTIAIITTLLILS